MRFIKIDNVIFNEEKIIRVNLIKSGWYACRINGTDRAERRIYDIMIVHIISEAGDRLINTYITNDSEFKKECDELTREGFHLTSDTQIYTREYLNRSVFYVNKDLDEILSYFL